MEYYDYGPRVLLPRPLALVGFMGARVSQVAHALTAVLGLPLHDLDRLVEHQAGASLSALQMRRGEAERRAIESKMLVRVTAEKPCGIIALGDGALLDVRNQALLHASTTLVYLERPLEVLQRVVERDLEAAPGRFPELVLAGGDVEPLWFRELFEAREPAYRSAHHRVDAGTLDSHRVADLLRDLLGLRPH